MTDAHARPHGGRAWVLGDPGEKRPCGPLPHHFDKTLSRIDSREDFSDG